MPTPLPTPLPAVYQPFGKGPDFNVGSVNRPSGTVIEVVVAGDIGNPTSIDFDASGNLYITSNAGFSLDRGSVFVVPNATNGTLLTAHTYADGLIRPTGVLTHETGVYVSNRGSIYQYQDTNGDLVADERTTVISGLPDVYRDHQTHGMALGPDGMIYVAQGGTLNCCASETDPVAGTIFRFQPGSSEFEIYSTGHRNPYDLAFNPAGDLFSTDNAPNIADPRDDPYDEFNHVVQDGDYGYPMHFGNVEAETGTISPIVLLPKHHSPTGLVSAADLDLPGIARGDMLLVMWAIGRIVRIQLYFDDEANKYVATEIPWASNVGASPIDVVAGPDNNLYIASMDTGQIWRLRRQ